MKERLDVVLVDRGLAPSREKAKTMIMAGNVFVTGPIIEDYLAFSVGVRRSWSEVITIPALAIINNSKKKERLICGKLELKDIMKVKKKML